MCVVVETGASEDGDIAVTVAVTSVVSFSVAVDVTADTLTFCARWNL